MEKMMATPDRDDRAQLLLVAGLVIAVLFVGLALLVNTAIYTENVATRGSDAGTDALEYQGAVVTTVGGFVDAENADEDSDARDNIENGDGIAEIEGALDEQFVRRGASAELEFQDKTDGFLILQNESRSFTNDADEPDHTLEENVESTRRYVFEVDPSLTSDDSDEFHVVLNETGSAAESRYYINADASTLTVRQEREDAVGGTETAECSVSHDDENVTFDLTGAVLEADQDRDVCQGFEWPDTYDTIEYRNGDEAGGTYQVTVETSDLDILDLIDILGDPSDGPFGLEAVYDVTVDIRYDSTSVSYETEVRIAPGEPDG